MPNKNGNFLDAEHVKVVFDVLVKFHSETFIYEEVKTKQMGLHFSLNQNYDLDQSLLDQKSEIQSLIPSLVIEDLEDLEEQSRTFRRTLCHGNVTTENLRFKYENQLPIHCRMLNFKPKYVSPVYDVLHLLFFATTEELRQHHFEDLLLYYHTSLTEDFKTHSLDIDAILPFEQFRKEVHHFLPIIKIKKALEWRDEESFARVREHFACPIVSREDCYSIVRNKIKTSNFEFLSFVVTSYGQVNGYLGNYHQLSLKIRHNFEETINCFIKKMPTNASAKNIVRETGCFFKEIFVYQTLVPQLQNMKIEAINGCLPTCYFQRFEDLVIFDDVTKKNFKTLPAQVPFNRHLLTLTYKKLAAFHASTLVFEEKMGGNHRLGVQYKEFLQEIFFLRDDTRLGARVMQVGLRSVIDVINLFPELKTESNQSNFKKVWPRLQEIFYEAVKSSDRYRNVLSHGDLWTNNIMIKFDGDEPVDCLFVDFQNIRYCPPAHDFLSILYLTTGPVARIQYEEEMKKVYHEEFLKIVTLHGCNAEEILSFDEFEETLEYIRPQMIIQNVMYKMFALCTSEEISSLLTNDKVSNFVFFEDRKEYLKNICSKSTRVKGALRDCIVDLYSLCESM